jgi:hypothetical protein
MPNRVVSAFGLILKCWVLRFPGLNNFLFEFLSEQEERLRKVTVRKNIFLICSI